MTKLYKALAVFAATLLLGIGLCGLSAALHLHGPAGEEFDTSAVSVMGFYLLLASIAGIVVTLVAMLLVLIFRSFRG